MVSVSEVRDQLGQNVQKAATFVSNRAIGGTWLAQEGFGIVHDYAIAPVYEKVRDMATAIPPVARFEDRVSRVWEKIRRSGNAELVDIFVAENHKPDQKAA